MEEDEATAALISRLEDFLVVSAEKAKLSGISRTREIRDRYERRLDTIRRICNEARPGLGDFQDTTWTGTRQADEAVRTAIGILTDRKDVDAELRGAGLRSMPGLDLHPRVWESAKSLWSSGRYGEALMASWKAVNADLQQRASCPDLSDDKLVSRVLASDGVGGHVLHLPGDVRTDTWKSRQRGLMFLGKAAVAGIRNPVAHDPDHDVPFSVAVEQLAALSLFAHWIDETESVDREAGGDQAEA